MFCSLPHSLTNFQMNCKITNKKPIHIFRVEIPLGDDVHHDLTNVLNQLPVDAFNDLFQGKFNRFCSTQVQFEWVRMESGVGLAGAPQRCTLCSLCARSASFSRLSVCTFFVYISVFILPFLLIKHTSTQCYYTKFIETSNWNTVNIFLFFQHRFCFILWG